MASLTHVMSEAALFTVLAMWACSACSKMGGAAPGAGADESAALQVAPPVPARREIPLAAKAKAQSTEVDIAAGTTEVDGKRVDVAAFSLDRTEVTVEAYAACVAAKRCTKPASDSPLCNWKHRDVRSQHPINCVTYGQATAFCESIQKRLPTAAEWQLAAGGSEARTYPWGAERPSNLWSDDSPEDQPGPGRNRLCWSGDGTDEYTAYATSTCPVHSYPSGDTPDGIADLAGNVAEWTASQQKLPMGKTAQLSYGGSFHPDPMGILKVRVQDSLPFTPDTQLPDIGFRCAR